MTAGTHPQYKAGYRPFSASQRRKGWYPHHRRSHPQKEGYHHQTRRRLNPGTHRIRNQTRDGHDHFDRTGRPTVIQSSRSHRGSADSRHRPTDGSAATNVGFRSTPSRVTGMRAGVAYGHASSASPVRQSTPRTTNKAVPS